VRVIDGDYNVFPPSSKEIALIGTAYFVDQRRLSCQLRCFGDITVDHTEQFEKQNETTKRPRGAQTEVERQESHARTGNIIFEGHEEEITAITKSAPKRYEDEKLRRAEDMYLKQQQKQELERIKRKDQKPESDDD
jgi:2Fe-2S ferredoxin